jgi:hypothetical protein
MSNSYTVRVQADGTLGEVYVEPANRFTACLADRLKTAGRVSTAPPRDDYWISWSVSGVMRAPEGCRDELTPPLWHTVKWWLFLGDLVFPDGAFRIRVLLISLSIVPFVVVLAAWRLLRPDDHERELALALLLGAGLVVLAAAGAFAIGLLAKEAKDENRENVLATVLFALPFLGSAPLAARALRRPRVPRGARVTPPAPGPARRVMGLLLLVSALLPSTAMAWFAAHENANRLCPTCVTPYKLRLP